QQQALAWESQGRPSELLLRKQTLLDAERWAAAHQSELTDPDLIFLNECRAGLSRLQLQSIIWEIQNRKSDYLLRGREMIEAKRWADEHDDQLAYFDREFLSACQTELSPLQQQTLLWESQSRSKKLLLDGTELLNADKWAGENSLDLNQSDKDFLEACHEAERIRARERKQAEHEQKQTRRIRRYGTIAIITAVIAVIGASLWVWYAIDLKKKSEDLIRLG